MLRDKLCFYITVSGDWWLEEPPPGLTRQVLIRASCLSLFHAHSHLTLDLVQSECSKLTWLLLTSHLTRAAPCTNAVALERSTYRQSRLSSTHHLWRLACPPSIVSDLQQSEQILIRPGNDFFLSGAIRNFFHKIVKKGFHWCQSVQLFLLQTF